MMLLFRLTWSPNRKWLQASNQRRRKRQNRHIWCRSTARIDRQKKRWNLPVVLQSLYFRTCCLLYLLVVLLYVICNTEKPKKFSIFICGSIDNNRFISHKSAGRYRLLRYKSMVKLLSTAAFRQYLRYLSIVNLVDFLVLSRYLIIIDF